MRRDIRLIGCDTHGKGQPWMAICRHVFRGTRPEYYQTATVDEPGQALCASCSQMPEAKVRQAAGAVAVCVQCYETHIVPMFGSS